MSKAINRFLELELRKEEVKQYFKDLQQAIEDVKAEVGIDGHFQAPDGTVFQIIQPKGTFIEYKTIDYVRTKREGEKRGSLAKKAAIELGYDL